MEGAFTDTIIDLLEQAKELSEKKKTEFDSGFLAGICETLEVIKAHIVGTNIEGLLDFDIDSRFLLNKR